MIAFTLTAVTAMHVSRCPHSPATCCCQRGRPAPKMMDLGDAVFVGFGVGLLGTTGLLFRSIATQRPFDRGIGSPFDFTPSVDDSGADSIIDKIRAARSTSAPGFVFAVEPEADEEEDLDVVPPEQSPLTAADSDALARARKREELERRMAKAVEQEDYEEAAAVKKELDGIS